MILEAITQKAKERIQIQKSVVSLHDLKSILAEQPPVRPGMFAEALGGEEISFICEIKKASPSKGVIVEEFPYLQIAREYETAGASAVSVLTEPYFFQGRNEYLQAVSKSISIPILRKDFTVDEYMIYEAKAIGAHGILLICSILSPGQLQEYRLLAEQLGMCALIEVHDEREAETALLSGASIIGVNNRNLKDFTVDYNNSLRLRKMIPEDVLFVSESGIKTPEDIRKLKENGTDAVLIGEALMRSPDKKKMLGILAGKREETFEN